MIGIECPSGNRVTVGTDNFWHWMDAPSDEDSAYAKAYLKNDSAQAGSSTAGNPT